MGWRLLIVLDLPRFLPAGCCGCLEVFWRSYFERGAPVWQDIGCGSVCRLILSVRLSVLSVMLEITADKKDNRDGAIGVEKKVEPTRSRDT